MPKCQKTRAQNSSYSFLLNLFLALFLTILPVLNLIGHAENLFLGRFLSPTFHARLPWTLDLGNSGPSLIAQDNSTRAVAFESVTWRAEPFTATAALPFGADHSTRVALFATGLNLLPGEGASVVTADAEDGSHRFTPLEVEYVGDMSGVTSVSLVIVKLTGELSDVGDVLVRINAQGRPSNRVRIGLGHIGGGPPDDPTPLPTPSPTASFSIAGRVLDDAGNSVSEATIDLASLSGKAMGSTLSDSSGSFSFANLPGGDDYTVKVSKAHFDSIPSSQTFTNLSQGQYLNVTAKPIKRVISGHVKEPDGKPLVNVTVNLTGTNSLSTTTDSNGSYTFKRLSDGGSYGVSAVALNRTLEPQSQSFPSLNGDQVVDFTGRLVTYSLAGKITKADGSGHAGVSVSLSGSQTGSTTTDLTGYYSFSALTAGGSYTVTPINTSGYNFSSQSISSLTSDQTLNFTGTLQKYQITGQVMGAGNALSGITVNLVGSKSLSTTTNSSGFYTFTELNASESYTVSPVSSVWYSFSSQNIQSLTGNQALNFSGVVRTYQISGQISAGGSNLAAVTINLTGSQIASATTNANGQYSFSGLPAGGSYTITPVNTGDYSFTSQSVTSLTSDQILNLSGTNIIIPPVSPSPSVIPLPTEIAASKPLQYLRFSEASGATVADSSGNSHSISLSGNYTRNVPELLRNAAIGDVATTLTNATGATSSSWFTTTTGCTVEMMVNFSSLSGIETIFTAGWQGSATEGFHWLYYDAGNQALYWDYNKSDGTGFVQTSAGWTPVIGRTYHIAVSHDYSANTINIYVDGRALAVTRSSTVPAFPITSKSISYFAGLRATVDEFAIFNGALPATRIKAHFAASRGADATSTAWYASPTGTIYSRGTEVDPFDLNTALGFSLVHAGDTIFLKDGIYTGQTAPSTSVGIWTATISGTSSRRIIIRALNTGAAILDGKDRGGSVLTLTGDYLDIAYLEIKKSVSTRSTSLINTQGCPITNAQGESVGGAGLDDKGNYNHAYYNYIHDVLGDGISSFQSATHSEYYGNIIAHNGWTAPRVLGDPPTGNGHGIYTQNLGTNGQKRIEENILFDSYSSPIAAKGSGAAYVENFLLRGNVSAYSGFAYDVGGGTGGIHEITIDGEMLYSVDFKPGYNSSANRDVTITNNYLVGPGGSGAPMQIMDFNSIVFTGNESMALANCPAGALFNYRIRTGHTFSESTVDKNIYWHNRSGQPNSALYTLGTGATFIESPFSVYQSATGWDTNSKYNNPNSNTFALPTISRTFPRAPTRYQLGRGTFVVFNWSGNATAVADLSGLGLQSGQAFSIYNALNPLGPAVATGNYNPSDPKITLTLTTAVSQRYGDASSSPLGTTRFNVFQVIPSSKATAPVN